MSTTYMDPDEARNEAVRRMRGALDTPEPTAEQSYQAGIITGSAINFVQHILQFTPSGRDQAIALTAAEDAKMRAIKAIFDSSDR